jgi:hypothetical protein
MNLVRTRDVVFHNYMLPALNSSAMVGNIR